MRYTAERLDGRREGEVAVYLTAAADALVGAAIAAAGLDDYGEIADGARAARRAIEDLIEQVQARQRWTTGRPEPEVQP